MSSIAQRLKRYMEAKQYSAYYVNKCAGLSTGLVLKTLQQDKTMTSASVEAILRAFPDLDADWLLTGRGRMLRDEKDLPRAEQPLPPDLAGSLYRCVIWHLLLQDSYAETMARLEEILAKLTAAQEKVSDLRDQLLRLQLLLKKNYEVQPSDHGLYEMSLRIAAGDDGRHTPRQLKDQFDFERELRKLVTSY
jgi:hypothetical protein